MYLHFRDYVTERFKVFAWEGQKSYSYKVFRTIPLLIWDTLKDAFIELLLLVALLYILLSVSQGKDMIISFFEPGADYGFARIVFTTLSIILYALCMWMVPAFLFETRDRYAKNKNKIGYPESLFSRHLFFMHRLLPMFVFWGMSVVFYLQPGMRWLFILLSIAQLIPINYLFDKKNYDDRRKARRIVILVYLCVVTILFVYLYFIFRKEYLPAKVVYSIILITLSFLVYAVFHWVDRRIILLYRPSEEKNVIKKYGWNSVIYISAFFSIAGALYFVIFIFNHIRVAPESLLLFLFAFYIFLIDFVFYIAKLNRITSIVTSLLLAGVIIFYAVNKPHFNLHHLKVDYSLRDTVPFKNDLGTLRQYYDAWKHRIHDRKDKTKPFPIILVAGEGGGSRAGYWFSQSILNLDSLTKGRLKDHIFSISTASGSTVGAGALYGYWQYRSDHQLHGTPTWTGYPKKIFHNNFTSGGIYGVLFEDTWKAMFPAKKWFRDRNSHLQQQEAVCIQRALYELRTDSSLATLPLVNRDEGLPDSEKKPYLLNKDFIYFFYEKDGDSVKFRTDMPLFFVNTCRSSDTRRAIISPVRLLKTEFPDAIDITRFVYTQKFSDDTTHGLNSALRMITAINMSELFPFLSAPAKIDNLGYFIDGGYHDNSGLKTTIDVYEQLEQFLQSDSLDSRDVELHVIYFKNGWSPKKYYPGEVKDVLPGLQPLLAVINGPFSGSASYNEEKALLRAPRFTNFALDYMALKDSIISKQGLSVDIYNDLFEKGDPRDTIINFPLARWTSRTVMDLMSANSLQFIAGNKRLDSLVRNISGNQ